MTDLWFYIPIDKTGHFGDVSPSQSLGLVWKKLKLTQQKHVFTKKCKKNSKEITTTQTTTISTPFNGLFSNLDFNGAGDSEWQWHQLGHMQVCTSLQTDNHANTPPLVFYKPGALPAAQPTASKH